MPVSDLDKVGRDVGEDGAPEGHEDAEATPDVLTQLQEQAGRHMFWAVTAVSHLFAMLRFAALLLDCDQVALLSSLLYNYVGGLAVPQVRPH